MSEEFLIYIWQFQLFDRNIQTTDGSYLQIIKPGERNFNSGPDFFNARIKIDDTIWAGNVEIHIHSSDWYRHKHEIDPAYDNIILHVVLKNDRDIARKNKQAIHTLELDNKFSENILKKYDSFIASKKWIPCQEHIQTINYFELTSFMDMLLVERLEQKAVIIKSELAHTKLDFQEVFYRKLARNFGFSVNGDAFELLAKSLPLRTISKHKNNLLQIESLLYGQAGMLEKKYQDEYANSLKSEYVFLAEKYNLNPIDQKLWKFMRLRPANFPTIRISQFAQLLYRSSALLTQILETEKLSDIISLFKVDTSEYWKSHFRFEKAVDGKKRTLGIGSINLILINTIIPFLFVYAQHKGDENLKSKALGWLELIKAEHNSIIKRFKEYHIKPTNALQSQALLQLKLNYCNNKRCLECRIGHFLLNR